MGYESVAIALFVDGYSPHRRTRHAVRSRLRDMGYELPVKRTHHNDNLPKR